jgi:hypothetical protein
LSVCDKFGCARVATNAECFDPSRDVEFDLEEDREKCLHGLATKAADRSDPSDVRRVAQAFKNPSFFVDGPSSTDVVQGFLGDCWFLSGIAAVASRPDLVEKFCVARDEQVGVYGFTFQRNGIWTDVIVRSQLLFFKVLNILDAANASLWTGR